MTTPPPLAETVAAFDRRSATYDRSGMHQQVADRVAERADLRPGQWLLDVAGGTGLVAKAVRRRQAGADVLVLDASPGMLAAAGPTVQRVRADAHRLPMRDGSVDVATVVTALHLMRDPDLVLREAARVARERVVFTTWAEDGWSVRRLLRQLASARGVVLADPHAGRRQQPVGLVDVEEELLVTTEPLDRGEVRIDVPPELREEFEAALQRETTVEHRLWLVSGRPRRRR